MINCLIVDDDPICRLEIEHMIKEVPFLHLVGTTSNAMDAFGYILNGEADLIFLDVIMPGITGFELLECMSKNKPKIIIMSTEGKYAADAFKCEVTDFLSKPVSEKSFLKAVIKAKRDHDNNKSKQESRNQIFIKVNSGLVKINTGDILYIKSQGDHSFIHTTTEVYEASSLLKLLEEKLQDFNFMRVHNSYIVNLDKISSIEGTSLLVNKAIVPVSQANFKNVMARLNILHRQEEVA